MIVPNRGFKRKNLFLELFILNGQLAILYRQKALLPVDPATYKIFVVLSCLDQMVGDRQ